MRLTPLVPSMILLLAWDANDCLARPRTTEAPVEAKRNGESLTKTTKFSSESSPSFYRVELKFALPEQIFSRQDSTRLTVGGPPGPCQLVQGPVKSRGRRTTGEEVQVTVRCATPGESGGREITRTTYWALTQPYYRPFDTQKWFFGYASDAAYYHLLAPPFDRTVDKVKLCQVQVSEVGKDELSLTVPARFVDEFVPGAWVRLIPVKGMESDLKKLSQPLPIEFANEESQLVLAEERLLRIGNAIHKYLGTLGHFPPALVWGPDSKPWHSWRVLILPYLGKVEHELFRQYDLTKPWKDKHNLKLVEKMPNVFRKPGIEHQGDTHSHFAVAVGDSTVFPGNGCTLPNEFRLGAFSKPNHALRYPPNNSSVLSGRNLSDGSANTILVGTVEMKEDMPWTRPTDVVLEQQADLEDPNGFSPCYRDRNESVAIFLFADGRVDRVPASLTSDVFQALFTPAGGEPIFAGMAPKHPEYLGYPKQNHWFVEIRERDGNLKAQVVREVR